MLIKECGHGDEQIYPLLGVQFVRAQHEKTANNNVGKKGSKKKALSC